MAVRRKVLVSGRVQGVFFRAHCAEEADARGVAGYVANLPDGRVEAVFEGDEDSVAEMIEWSRRGSGPAQVEDVEVVDETPEGLAGFETR